MVALRRIGMLWQIEGRRREDVIEKI